MPDFSKLKMPCSKIQPYHEQVRLQGIGEPHGREFAVKGVETKRKAKEAKKEGKQ